MFAGGGREGTRGPRQSVAVVDRLTPVATERCVERALRAARQNLRAGRCLSNGIPPADWQGLLDRYCHFVDRRDGNGYLSDSEVVLTSLQTPRPCLHLMASTHSREFGIWGSFWDQFGGGFSCLESVLAGRMTSHHDTNYVPTGPEPQDIRSFFVHEAGNAWPMFPRDGLEAAAYTEARCVQGLGHHLVQAQREQLAAELEVCVHPDVPLEVWRVRIKNVGKGPRRFSWFSHLRVDIDSVPSYYFVPRVVCEGLIQDGAMVFVNHDKGNRHRRQAFFYARPRFEGFDMSGEAFAGVGGRSAVPHRVRQGRCTDSLGFQPYAGLVAAAQFNAALDPGEAAEWICAYGACPHEPSERAGYLARVRREVLSQPQETHSSVRAAWTRRVGAMMVRTPSADLDRYLNVWSKYQACNQARLCRALDKVGYRDILQDLLGVCDCDLSYVRTMLLRSLQFQAGDGSALRQYEKIPGTGHDLRTYVDSCSWIPDAVSQYVKESGDLAFMDEEVPFFDMDSGQPSESQSGTVYEHAFRAIRYLADSTGYHGLCRIGYGDWNDALSGIGGDGGVSVWVSCACVFAARKMEELASYLGRRQDAAEARQIADVMTDRINEQAWDGEWYIYAINGKGTPIGSKQSREGKIHLNVNAWALFTGVARAAGREDQVWRSLEQLDTPIGHKLLAPPYTAVSRAEVGRIADQKPGTCENGSIYTHGEAFYLYALITRGRADACYRRLLSTIPSAMVQDIATGPRHQQCNFTVGPDHPSYGAQLFSNFSGSVAWYRRAIERMLGVYADFDSLAIAPCVPEDWDSYEVRKVWRGRTVQVALRRSLEGEDCVTLDGHAFGSRIPAAALKRSGVNYIEVRFS